MDKIRANIKTVRPLTEWVTEESLQRSFTPKLQGQNYFVLLLLNADAAHGAYIGCNSEIAARMKNSSTYLICLKNLSRSTAVA